MGFNLLYVNPWHQPGFSGSLYAVRDYDLINNALLPPDHDGDDTALLRTFAEEADGAGLGLVMDLVVNHTARDSPLVAAHASWYRRDERGAVISPSVSDPADASKVTVWGDLAEIDNARSPDREGLWRFWESVVDGALELGVSGFRCDAAYKVPLELWRRLIGRARAARPDAIFLAETLGARLDEIHALAGAGFDYFYNSSKWWNFVDRWALDQHEQFRRIAPSISFPESHDTARLAAETGGNEAVQRLRYAFAAVFSAGIQITIGYEYGFRRSTHVVETRPASWERKRFDLTRMITGVNALKRSAPLLRGEGVLRSLLAQPGGGVVILERTSEDRRARGLIVINTHWTEPRRVALAPYRPAGMARTLTSDNPDRVFPVTSTLELGPAELVLIADGR
jgi:starch synthase (maltosyl-transferring)